MADKPVLDVAEIEKKVDAGEAISQEEKEFAMEYPDAIHVVDPKGDIKPKDEPSDTAKADEKPADESQAKSEEKPAAEADQAKTKKVDEENRLRIEQELLKPDGEENLDGLDFRSKGLFYELRKTRRRAQTAEKERDVLKFQNAKRETERREAEAKAKEAPKEAAEPDDEELEIPDDEIVTGKELKAILAKTKTKANATDVTTDRHEAIRLQTKIWQLEAKIQYPDWDEVIALDTAVFGETIPAEIREEVEAAAMNPQGNPAKVLYNLIKASEKWPEVEKKLKKPAAAAKPADEKRAEKLDENEQKVRTTGNAGGSAVVSTEMSLSEYVNLSDEDFSKLPAKTRKAFLDKYGS